MRTVTGTEENYAARIKAFNPWRVCSVEAMPDYRFSVAFADASSGVVDMSLFLAGDCGVFQPLRDVELFNAVFVEHGAVTWPGELDLAPDQMYAQLQKMAVYVIAARRTI